MATKDDYYVKKYGVAKGISAKEAMEKLQRGEYSSTEEFHQLRNVIRTAPIGEAVAAAGPVIKGGTLYTSKPEPVDQVQRISRPVANPPAGMTAYQLSPEEREIYDKIMQAASGFAAQSWTPQTTLRASDVIARRTAAWNTLQDVLNQVRNWQPPTYTVRPYTPLQTPTEYTQRETEAWEALRGLLEQARQAPEFGYALTPFVSPQIPTEYTQRETEAWEALRGLLEQARQAPEFGYVQTPFTPPELGPIDVESVRRQLEELIAPTYQTQAQQLREEHQRNVEALLESLGRRNLLFSPVGGYLEQLTRQELERNLAALGAQQAGFVAERLVQLLESERERALRERAQAFQEWLGGEQLGLEATRLQAENEARRIQALLEASGMTRAAAESVAQQFLQEQTLGLQARQAQAEALARLYGVATEAARPGLERELELGRQALQSRQLDINELLGLLGHQATLRGQDIQRELGLGEIGVRMQQLRQNERQFAQEMAFRWADLASRERQAEADRELQRTIANQNYDVAKQRLVADTVQAMGAGILRAREWYDAMIKDVKDNRGTLDDINIGLTTLRPLVESLGLPGNVIDSLESETFRKAQITGIRPSKAAAGTDTWVDFLFGGPVAGAEYLAQGLGGPLFSWPGLEAGLSSPYNLEELLEYVRRASGR